MAGSEAANRRPSSRRGAFRSVRRSVSQTRTDSIPRPYLLDSLVVAIARENYEGSYFTYHCALSDDGGVVCAS